MPFIYFNSDFLPSSQSVLNWQDLSVQRGYGVFEFFRIRDRVPVFLEDHLDRFFRSASGLHLPVTCSREDLKKAIHQLIIKNEQARGAVRITLTGGYSNDGYSIGKPNLIISSHSFTEPTANQRHEGIRLMSYDHQRQLPEIKSIDYLMALWLQPLLKTKGVDDVLYHRDGWITECPRSNFFLISKNEEILTPSKNILKGITRSKLLLLKEFPVREAEINLEDLKQARGAFITSTTKTILPVNQIDGHTLTGATGAIADLYQAFTQTFF